MEGRCVRLATKRAIQYQLIEASTRTLTLLATYLVAVTRGAIQTAHYMSIHLFGAMPVTFAVADQFSTPSLHCATINARHCRKIKNHFPVRRKFGFIFEDNGRNGVLRVSKVEILKIGIYFFSLKTIDPDCFQ